MTIYPRCRKRTFWTKPWWRLLGVLCDCPDPYCYPMGSEGPREFVRMAAEDAQRYREPWPRMTERERQQLIPSLQAKIAALTEQRDIVTERLEELVAFSERRDRVMKALREPSDTLIDKVAVAFCAAGGNLCEYPDCGDICRGETREGAVEALRIAALDVEAAAASPSPSLPETPKA